ncbi:MAG: bi-domain-containing oxidoreductase [Anaerolineales bacterium]|jgi:predicted dehydrogenase/threonine dehydrogenase-like Zn-dependent dehydrogenase
MKQVVQEISTGETVLLEVPLPSAQPGMALVKTAASLVSVGTERALVEFAGKSLLGKARSRPDLVRQVIEKVQREGLLTTYEAVQNRLDQPMPLGYASAGTIVEVGEGLEGFQVGDRVACAGGGFAVHAEYAFVPSNLLAKLPDEVNFAEGAVTTLGAIALHGFRLGEVGVRDRVAVIGLGLLGLLAAMIARAGGCAVLAVDVDPKRVKHARSLGFNAVEREIAERESASFTGGHGFDLVQICADTVTNDTVELAGTIARDKGVVVSTGVVGTQLPRKTYFEKELRFVISRSYGPGRYDPDYEEGGRDYPYGYVRWTEGRNLEAFIELVAEDKVDAEALITHQFPIEQALEAYEFISKPDGEFIGVLLTYAHEAEGVVPQKRIELLSAGRRTDAQVTLGVIGAGNFATAVLFPAMKKVSGLEWIGLATASGISSGNAGRRYGFQYATSEVNELLQDERINTVVVLTRHHLHAQQVTAALAAGKHVFCEKPLAMDQDSLKQVVHSLSKSEGLLTVGFNRRFAPLAQVLKESLSSISDPLMMHYRVNAGLLPPDHWLHDPDQGGGRIIGEGCHFIDFLTYLAGEPPEDVQTVGVADDDRYREDNVQITLRFASGSIGTITYLANGSRAFPKERVEIFGGGHTAVLDDYRRLEVAGDGRRRVFRSWLRQDKGHRGEWQAFRDAIRGGGPPPISYSDLIAVSQASFAALQSLRSGERITIEPLVSI